MLAAQHWNSDGVSTDAVGISNRLVANTRLNDNCHTGIKLGANGVLSTIQNNGGFSAKVGEWLVVGDAADYYVRHTISDGNLQTEPPFGWNQMNVDRIYESISTTPDFLKRTIMFVEIAEDALGASIVASATYTLSAEVFGGGA